MKKLIFTIFLCLFFNMSASAYVKWGHIDPFVKWGGTGQMFAIPNTNGWCVTESVYHDSPHFFYLRAAKDNIGMCYPNLPSCKKSLIVSDYINNRLVSQHAAIPGYNKGFIKIMFINNIIPHVPYVDNQIYMECYVPHIPDKTIKKNVMIWVDPGPKAA